MHEIGLYHPRIHFPSDAWIKTAALYWTKLARIVPFHYVPHDSETVRALRDELDFVVDVAPHLTHEVAFDGGCDEFLQFVANNHAGLRRHYGPGTFPTEVGDRPFGLESWDSEHGEPLAAEVGYLKIALIVRQLLVEHGLAVATGSSRATLLMHPDLARVYMSALAEDVAYVNHLRPTTDDRDVFAVGTGWTEARMRDLLLPQGESGQPAPDHRSVDPDLIGMIAVQAVVPAGIDQIPVRKIIRIRERFAPQFTAFRDAVDGVAADLGKDLRKVRDPAVARAYLEQEVRERLLTPVDELRRELRRARIDTATATLTFKYEVPALAGLVAGGALAHEPLLAGGAAAAVGLLSLVRNARLASRDRDSSPASYLLTLSDQLDAHSTLHRAARRIRRQT